MHNSTLNELFSIPTLLEINTLKVLQHNHDFGLNAQYEFGLDHALTVKLINATEAKIMVETKNEISLVLDRNINSD